MWDEEWSGNSFSNFTETDNLTLTCAARHIQGPIELPYSSTLTITLRALQSTYYFFIVATALFLNTLVITLVAKYKKLHTLSYLVSLQVVVLDLLLSAILPAAVITAVANKWILGEHVCAISGLIATLTTLTRTLLMCVLVIDRYLAVMRPFFYPKYKLKVTVGLSVASWVFSALVSLAMLPGLFDCYTFTSIAKLCVISSSCNLYCSLYVRIYSVMFVPATTLPILLYSILYCKSIKIKREVSDLTAHKHYHKEWKATITFSLLFLTLFALILPATVVLAIVIALSSGNEYSPAAYSVLAINSCTLSLLTITDPIVIMRDKNMKEILYNILQHLHWPSSDPQTTNSDERSNSRSSKYP